MPGNEQIASELPVLLARYLSLMDDSFVMRMEDADPNARAELTELLSVANALAHSPQLMVFAKTIQRVLNNFYKE
jgi:hypothetical protein